MKPVAETINDDLLRRYDVAGPRYTSYPTADRFVEAFTADDYAQALTMRRGGAAAMNLPLSLYLHIPFLRVAVLLLCLQQNHYQAP